MGRLIRRSVTEPSAIGATGESPAAIDAVAAPSGAPKRAGLRSATSGVLIVLAALTALAGGLTLYIRQELVTTSAFADRTADALRQPALQSAVARELTVQLIEPSLPDAIAARPAIQGAVQSVISSEPFRPVIRLVAENGHKLLFERHGGNAVFDVADAGTVVAGALRTLAPKVAREIPRDTEAVLLTLRKRNFATVTLRFAEAVRVLGIVLLPVAAVLLALAIWIAPDRRRALTRSGIAAGLVGLVAALALECVRRYVVAHVYGTDELNDADVRGAVGDLWGAYLDDLMTWLIGVTVAAWLIAAAAAPILRPYSALKVLGVVRARVSRLPVTPLKAAIGFLTFGFGIFLVIDPRLGIEVVAVLVGAVLLYFGAGEILTATAPARPRGRRARPSRRRVLGAALSGVSLIVAVTLAVIFAGAASSSRASSGMACNGYPQLCDRRLDEVVFAGTHNSMSAADTPGWLIANQDRAVGQQLNDGIRLFKVSTHYGTEDSTGWVHTDIAAEGERLNRVAARLSPSSRIALQRLSASVGPGSLKRRKRDVWLCHTLCELGATKMLDFLATIRRFIQLNPDTVIVMFDEDYVKDRDIESVFKRAGLFNRLETLPRQPPLPTLASLIKAKKNILLFAQKPPDSFEPWNPYAFGWIQDTPLGATKPSQFTCKLERGSPRNPLLMMNNWADVFPPRPSPNLPLVKQQFILDRAQQCVTQRGKLPTMILTDYYNRGDVIGAAATLNGVSGTEPAPVKRVANPR